MKEFALWLRTLYLLWCATSVLSLEGLLGKEGVCKNDTEVVRSRPERVWVSYTELQLVKCGFLGLKTCQEVVTTGKWVTQPNKTWTEIVTMEFCCEGYKEENGRCIPVCAGPEGCINGVCTAPNFCTCIGGYLKKEGTQECYPHCSEPCDPDRFCSAPETCSCRSGFEPDAQNATKCNPTQKLCLVKCDHGYCPEATVCICLEGYFYHKYEKQSDSNCEPICQKECVNATCTAPEYCSCNDGYRKSEEDNICIPNICEKPCVNGFCNNDSKCVCKRGYKQNQDDPNFCQPVCSKPCENGMCISPEECTCLTNYTLSKEDRYVCKPFCKEGCVNGDCVAPNVCTCKEGYKLNDANICEPICEEKCINGVCSAPNTCTCLEGFKNDPVNVASCQPVCTRPCLNASCTAPETCTCYNGYEKVPDDKFRCLPVCPEKCVNAECSDPGVCSCFKGYVKDVERPNVCVPVCSRECKNGTCSAPETCLCHSGYKLSPQDPSICDPSCSQACVNGVCVSPEVCMCNDGYEPDHTLKHRCNPVCKQECIHGTCYTPDKCTCDKGYVEGDKPFTCVPHCTRPCINGECTAPDFCECYPDHVKDEEEPHICHAKCAAECVNGYCKSTDTCECREGFYPTKDQNICTPMCSACTNGVCEAPEKCKCEEGYENPPGKPGECVPICRQGCVNATCTEPDSCSCNNGYVRVNANSCRPYCSKCENGDCVGPKMCVCHSGYKRNKKTGSCDPICVGDCINGVCLAPNSCVCLWGYVRSDIEPNKCVENKVSDLNTCFFEKNVLLRNNASEVCFTGSQMRLTDLGGCALLSSVVLKYLNDPFEGFNVEVTFDCVMNYFREDVQDPTLLLDCTIEEINDISEDMDTEAYEEGLDETDLEDARWLYEEEENEGGRNEDEDSDEDDRRDRVTRLSSEEEETITMAPGMPKVFIPPLLPSPVIPQILPDEPDETEQNLRQKQVSPLSNPIIEELEKQNKTQPIFPTVKKAVGEIWKDLRNLKKEIKELEAKEKEVKKVKKAKATAKGEETDGKLKGRIEPAEDEIEELVKNSKNEVVLKMHNVPKNLTHFPIVTKLYHLPFVRKEKVSNEWFKDLKEEEIIVDWCLCLSDDMSTMCLDGKHFKMTLCPCDPEPRVPGMGGPALKFVYWSIMFVLAVISVCFVTLAVRYCRKRRRKRKLFPRPAEAPEVPKKSIPGRSSLEVKVEAVEDKSAASSTQPHDEVEASSKL